MMKGKHTSPAQQIQSERIMSRELTIVSIRIPPCQEGTPSTQKCQLWVGDTLPKTNITPENRPSQKETSIPTIHFHVRAVSFREGMSHEKPSDFHYTRWLEGILTPWFMKESQHNWAVKSPKKQKKLNNPFAFFMYQLNVGEYTMH